MKRILNPVRVLWITGTVAGLLTALPPAMAQTATRNGSGAAAADRSNLKFGFARDSLAKVDAFLQSYVDSGRIARATALVLRDGNVAYERSVGWADVESRKRMSMDAMFRIASQTKALTSVAIMM